MLRLPVRRLFSTQSSSGTSSQSRFLASTLHEVAALLKSGDASSVELTAACLEQARRSSALNAYITETPEVAFQQAEAADQRRKEGKSLGPLDGVPVAVKDLFCTDGVLTTAGSKMLGDFVPPYDATVYARLKASGAVLIGKTNMDEFAMGSATTHTPHGPCVNPWSPAVTKNNILLPHSNQISTTATNRLTSQDMTQARAETRGKVEQNGKDVLIAGGSSGGSAVALAARTCFGSLGSDTGGSVRQPASLCGVVGLKPTYGRLSRYGMIAYSSSLDCPGIFAHSVRDTSLLLDAISGGDKNDSTCVDLPATRTQKDAAFANQTSLKGIRIGIPQEYRVEESDQELWNHGIQILRDAGAEIVEVSLPHTRHALATYYVIAPAEASSNLARYDGVRYGHSAQNPSTLQESYTKARTEGFGDEVKRRILTGAFALSVDEYKVYFKKAQQVRRLIAQDFDNLFRHPSTPIHAILTPTTTRTAYPLPDHKAMPPVEAYANDVFTIPASLAGLPAISVPVSFKDSLPQGLQLIGRPLDELTVLQLAQVLENGGKSTNQVPPGIL